MQTLINNFNILIIIFVIGIIISYLVLAIISIVAIRQYRHRESFAEHPLLLSSEFAPAISIIAPAYNESKTIKDNVRSLLSLNYNNYEVIIVNDGSKDDTMDVLINAYGLVRTEYTLNGALETKSIAAVYRSAEPAFKNLVVIDKMNGGKSDALNAGINISSNPYILNMMWIASSIKTRFLK